MAIIDLGEAAVSFTGSQAGIVTDTAHRKAKILEIRTDRLREALDGGSVAVVAGFQGVSTERAITTLGRGGSDTTAVALAAALEADVCEIYTDVAGVYTADPRIVPDARRLERLSYDEMLEMSATGGRVLALRSVEFARNYGVPVHVRSSFTWESGTWVKEEEPGMEAPIISGVTHDISEAKVTIFRVPDRPGIAAKLFRALADENVNVDMIEQNVSTDDHTDISFTIPRDELARTMEIVDKVVVEIDAGGANFDDAIGRVSLVGAGMKTNPGVAAQMFETLAAEGVNIEMISTSTIRISCVVHENDVERAVRALHSAFELEARVVSDRGMRVGVVGATGLVGTEMLRLLHERAFPVSELRAYASTRSEGRSLPFGDGDVTCQVLGDGCFDGLDLVVIDVDDPLALEWAPRRGGERRTCRRQLGGVPHRSRRPPRGQRGQPRRRARLAEGHRVVPQLHDDGPGHRAGAAASRRRHRAHGRVDATSRSRAPGSPACASSTSSGPRAPVRPTATHGPRRSRTRSRRARCGTARSPAT